MSLARSIASRCETLGSDVLSDEANLPAIASRVAALGKLDAEAAAERAAILALLRGEPTPKTDAPERQGDFFK